MTIQQAIEKLNTLESTQKAYYHAMSVLSLDGATAAPKRSALGRGKTLGVLSGVTYQLMVNDETREVLTTILDQRDQVDPLIARRAELLKEDLDDMTRIPMDEYVAFQTLTSDADAVWHEAKEKSDYAMFAPYLEKIIDFNRRFAGYKNADKPAYDMLLDDYEKGASMATLDNFFGLLREKLTPVILEVAKRPAPRTDFLRQVFPVHQQRIFSDKVMAMMGMDRDCCAIAETEHPFTDGFNKWDVRITTNYHENELASSLYSVIHEGGHALYELGTADEMQFTCLASGSTMGIHESQSRFYENLIGRSLPFCKALLPVAKEIFPTQLSGVTPEMLYAAVNEAKPSLIRTEADELTYAHHVMIRYEMEKLMMSGDAKVNDLPALWNKMYKDYLGVTVPNDREGILQDVHWAGGSIGYFPSYALGSAYGVQMLSAMEKDIDVWGIAEKGDLRPITAWLGEKIHRHGRFLKPNQLLEQAMGAPFDPNYYVDYLVKKFSALYDL